MSTGPTFSARPANFFVRPGPAHRAGQAQFFKFRPSPARSAFGPARLTSLLYRGRVQMWTLVTFLVGCSTLALAQDLRCLECICQVRALKWQLRVCADSNKSIWNLTLFAGRVGLRFATSRLRHGPGQSVVWVLPDQGSVLDWLRPARRWYARILPAPAHNTHNILVQCNI